MAAPDKDNFPVLLAAIVRKRAVIKRKITNLFSKIAACDDSKIKNVHKCSVLDHLVEVQEFDQEICSLYDSLLVSEDLPENYLSEIDNQSAYSINIKEELSKISTDPPPKPADNTSVGKPKLPTLNCPNFSGEKSSSMDYFSFFNQFNNVVGLNSSISDGTKFSYLKSFLTGYAQKVIQHLNCTDDNYSVARVP